MPQETEVPFLKAVHTIEGNVEEAFKKALESCTDPLQAFIVEVQHSINQLVTKYQNTDIAPGDIITKGLTTGLASTRISLLMRLDMPLNLIGQTIPVLFADEMVVTRKILGELLMEELMHGFKEPKPDVKDPIGG